MTIHLQDDGAMAGRGTWWNTANRFEHRDWCYEEEDQPGSPERVATELFEDHAKSIISRNDSPDVGFEASINPYRGCEHGCVYCYARPTHEYMGYSAGLDFETKLFYKPHAAALLASELARPSWKPTVIAMSGVTDPYQPVERRMGLTRACLGVLAERRNPVVVVTKNRLVARDADLLGALAAEGCAAVLISLTTLDLGLNRKLEPRSSSPAQRLEAMAELHEAGIPVGVLVAPIIPGQTDHEVLQLLSKARAHGARFAGYVMLRLPHAVAPLFSSWLAHHYPDRSDKVLNRIKSMRGGALNRSVFGERMRGTGVHADQVSRLFDVMRRKLGFEEGPLQLRTDRFRPPGGEQLQLW